MTRQTSQTSIKYDKPLLQIQTKSGYLLLKVEEMPVKNLAGGHMHKRHLIAKGFSSGNWIPVVKDLTLSESAKKRHVATLIWEYCTKEGINPDYWLNALYGTLS